MPRDAEDAVVDTLDPEQQPAESTPKGGEKGEGKNEARELRKQLEANSKRIKELEESERHWATLARSQRQEPEQAEEDEDEDEEPSEPEVTDDSPEKFADAISAEGLAALVKRGVMTRKEAARMLQRKQRSDERRMRQIANEAVENHHRKVSGDARITTAFPDLKPGTPLYERTLEHLKEAAELDGKEIVKSHAVVMACARAAKAELDAEKRRSRRDEDGEPDFDLGDRGDDEDETERRRRVREQSGDRGRSRGFDEDRASLSPLQREMIQAMGIDEKTFRQYQTPRRGSYRRAA